VTTWVYATIGVIVGTVVLGSFAVNMALEKPSCTVNDVPNIETNCYPDAEKEKIIRFALCDERVQQVINNRPYTVDCCGYIANLDYDAVEVYFTVDNETQMTVDIDLDTRNVVAIQTTPVFRTQPPVKP